MSNVLDHYMQALVDISQDLIGSFDQVHTF